MSKQRWLQERRRDFYWRRAKQIGLPSRAAFKLQEIQEKWNVIRPGDYVLDLGAAPGGFTALASKLTGPTGLVVAVDVEQLRLTPQDNVVSVAKDVFDQDLEKTLTKLAGGKHFDTIISDLSPRHTGDYHLLAAQQLELIKRALQMVRVCLRRGGNFVAKSFEHPDLRDLEKEIGRLFVRTERFVPKATKKRSSEIFIVGLGFRGPASS